MLGWSRAEAALASRMNRTFVFGIEADVRWQKLKSHPTFEFQILGFVDDSHASFPKLLDNAIVGNGLPDSGRALAANRHRDLI